jgi:hypothetical protein
VRWFVPEGQADRSQARSAWNNEKMPRPSGTIEPSGTDNDFDRPFGAGPSASLSRYFVPVYYRAVPLGLKPFTHRSSSNYLSVYRIEPLAESYSPEGRPPSGANSRTPSAPQPILHWLAQRDRAAGVLPSTRLEMGSREVCAADPHPRFPTSGLDPLGQGGCATDLQIVV